MRYLIFLISLVATPAMAEVCDDLWFTRNLVMDRAGYCFGSNLGKAIFDNSDCTGKSVKLDRRSQRLVNQLLEQEKIVGCKVNTKKRSLDLPDIKIRWRLEDLPVADEHESGCIGWREAPTALYAGRDSSSPVVSQIQPGDNLLFSHWAVGGWDYVIIQTEDWGRVKGSGWLNFKTNERSCRQWAG